METNQATMQNLLNEAAAQQPPIQQPMQELQPQQEPIELQLRAHELIAQARTIQAVARVDVLALYNTDAEVRQKVLSGEWDFIDVWKTLQPAPTPPAPMRTANGGAAQLGAGGGCPARRAADDGSHAGGESLSAYLSRCIVLQHFGQRRAGASRGGLDQRR